MYARRREYLTSNEGSIIKCNKNIDLELMTPSIEGYIVGVPFDRLTCR